MGRVKVRLIGLPDDVEKLIQDLKKYFDVVIVYPRTYEVGVSKHEIRKYLEIEV